MSTFALIPGAGGSAWYWSRVVPLLEDAGHHAIAIDLPGDKDNAGLPDYTRLVVDAIDESPGVALVAQSLGGFTAPMVTEVVSVESLTLVNAMIPVPGETPGQWWENTGALDARAAAAAIGGYGDFEPETYFLHDVPPEVVAEGTAHQRPEADAVFASRCEFTTWPSVSIRVLVGSDDRFFPAEFQRRIARERLGLDVDVVPGGHLLALARPESVANYLLQA